MKELIESIENQIKFNSNVVISKDDANKLLQALTSVKSAEEVLEQSVSNAKGGIGGINTKQQQ